MFLDNEKTKDRKKLVHFLDIYIITASCFIVIIGVAEGF